MKLEITNTEHQSVASRAGAFKFKFLQGALAAVVLSSTLMPATAMAFRSEGMDLLAKNGSNTPKGSEKTPEEKAKQKTKKQNEGRKKGQSSNSNDNHGESNDNDSRRCIPRTIVIYHPKTGETQVWPNACNEIPPGWRSSGRSRPGSEPIRVLNPDPLNRQTILNRP